MICYNSHLRSVLLMPVSKLQQHSCINIAHGSGDILIPAQLSEERLNDLHMKTLAVGLLLEFIFQMKHDTSRLYCPAGQIKVSDMWLIDVTVSCISWSMIMQVLCCTFTFMHLADAFIQSDLQCIQAIHIFVSTCSVGNEPTTFALLTQCSNHWATGTLWYRL